MSAIQALLLVTAVVEFGLATGAAVFSRNYRKAGWIAGLAVVTLATCLFVGNPGWWR